MFRAPVPVAARSKAWVYGRSPAAIVGLNPTGGLDVCVLCVLCVVRERSLRPADHSSTEVLPTVARRCVYVTTKRRERGGHSPHWAARPKKIIK
jgi:hypothetical protein